MSLSLFLKKIVLGTKPDFDRQFCNLTTTSDIRATDWTPVPGSTGKYERVFK